MARIAPAHWDTMKRWRSIFKEEDASLIETELDYTAVRVNQRKDKKGKVAKSVGGGPKIVLSSPIYYKSAKGKDIPVKGASLFTWTSKMSCPSFSLPAGPPQFGGTCPASLIADVKNEGSYRDYYPHDISGGKYVCSVCYAGKGFYSTYPSVSISQMIHLNWVLKAIEEGTFVDSMVAAIEAIQEDEDKLQDQMGTETRYFRIHDSGDFDLGIGPAYYEAWCQVCEVLGHIRFWAPTRLWVFRSWMEAFGDSPPPPNLALRPSGLIQDTPPPDIDGLDAGTMCHLGDFDGVKSCPAYQEAAKTCHNAKCRTCWTQPDIAVNYWTH